MGKMAAALGPTSNGFHLQVIEEKAGGKLEKGRRRKEKEKEKS